MHRSTSRKGVICWVIAVLFSPQLFLTHHKNKNAGKISQLFGVGGGGMQQKNGGGGGGGGGEGGDATEKQ